MKIGADPNPDLANSVQSLLSWASVELNKDNPERLIELVKRYIHKQLGQDCLNQNASARYALFIYEAG